MTSHASVSQRGDPAWLLVAAVALASYGAALGGTFVFDDLHSVRDNPAIRDLANLPAFFVDLDMFSALENRMYRPVLLCSFALTHAVGGLEPLAYKLGNVALHAATSILLWSLLRRGGAQRGPALLAAALFAAHPLASEAVNMVSGRSELLAVCAIAAALRLHLAAMADDSRRRWASVLGTAACAAVACGSKETGVVLPALLVVLECVRPGMPSAAANGARWRAAAVRVLPVVAVVIAYLLVRRALFGVSTVALPSWQGSGDPFWGHGRDLATQLATMAVLLPRCIAQVVVPVGLSLDPYVPFTSDWASAPVLCGAALIALLTALGLRAPRRRPLLFLGTAVAGSLAAPWVLIPLNVPLCEHRLYGPMLGLAIAVGSNRLRLAPSPRVRTAASALVVVVFSALASLRSLDYRDEAILWRDVLETNPHSVRALCGLAQCHALAGRFAESRRLTRRALQLCPSHVPARRNLAETNIKLGERGDPWVAVLMAESLVELSPRNPFHRLLLARALTAAGARTGAAEHYDAAVSEALHCLEIAPPKALVYRTAAAARRQQGDLDAALELLDRGIRDGLDHHSLLLDRVDLLRALGRHREADRAFRRAAQRAPFDPRVLRERFAPTPR